MPLIAHLYFTHEVEPDTLIEDDTGDGQGMDPGDRDMWWEEPEA